MLTTVGMEFKPFRDVTPFTFAFGNLIVAWGIFRYHLFDIIPIARDLIVDNMEDLVVVLDMQDRIVDINPSALVAINQKPSQVIGQPAETILSKWPELLEKFDVPENINIETTIFAEGRQFQYEVKSTLLHDKYGRYIGRVFVSRDISEHTILKNQLQKLNEELDERVAHRTEDLRKGEERLRAIVDEAPFGAHLYELEADERLVFIGANHSADQILHVDHQQFIGKTIEEAFPPLAETDIPAAYRRVATSGERFQREQVDYDDTRIRGAFEIHAFQTGKQQMAVFFRDITERKKAEEALRESEEKHRLLFEKANDAIFIMKDACFVDCNTKAIEMFGYTRGEIIGKSPQDFSPGFQLNGLTSEEMAHKFLGATLQTGESQYFEWRHIHKDKTEFDVEVSLNLLELDNEKFVQAIVRDITERKLAEKKLAEAYETTLEGWAKALELRDKETEDHSRRVVELTVKLAKAMGIEGDELHHIRRGAILHDIGKMGIPDEILRKRGKLTISERKVIEQHPVFSYELLSRIPYLEKAIDIPYCHHEHWDGSGYPRGLKGERIPLAARIFTVIDVWDAVQYDRPYNRAWPKEKAIQYLKDEAGKYFDPECVSVFLALVEQGKI